MNYRNSHGKWITMYDTDEFKVVDKIYDNYNIRKDVKMMMDQMKSMFQTIMGRVDGTSTGNQRRSRRSEC